MSRTWIVIGIVFLCSVNRRAFSQEEATSEAASEESTASGEAGGPAKSTKVRKRKVTHEKEAEGTQAPNRFDSDPILKSKYELNGQSLEVDPD